jgi:hypothetical protein
MSMEDQYVGRLIAAPTLEAVRGAARDYEVMLVSILDAILERYERDPSYHFINTKLSIITGEDFPELADASRDFKGKSAVYGWIQGRGLESLVGHIRWLAKCSALSERERADRIGRLTAMVADVFDQMEKVRARCGGRVWFVTTPDGQPFDIGPDGRRRPFDLAGQATTSGDRFYVKGMIASAALLGRQDKLAQARDYLRQVVADIEEGRSGVDRFSFDPKNKVQSVPGRFGHGNRMIAIGAIALFAELLNEDEWFEIGERFVRHIVDRYINLGQFSNLQPYDFYETIDAKGNPWVEDGRILSDPGHSLEFIGLAAKFLLLLRDRPEKTPSQRELLERCAEIFPNVLARNFANGFNPKAGGICKAFDLISRKPINSDMPWWSLPETMRAAAELLHLCPDAVKAPLLKVIADCSNGFVRRFVNRRVHLMAYQTIDKAGKPVDVIPATPDADPGYHTGLSIIDFLRCIATA